MLGSINNKAYAGHVQFKGPVLLIYSPVGSGLSSSAAAVHRSSVWSSAHTAGHNPQCHTLHWTLLSGIKEDPEEESVSNITCQDRVGSSDRGV